MSGIGAQRLAEWRREAELVERVLAACPPVDKTFAIPTSEFVERQQRVARAVRAAECEVGFVFSDEHYDGDVPYLGGNTNIQIEQVAGAIGPSGFHIIAGLEGGYIAEQLADRARATVHKVELLQLADEKYPIVAERIEHVLDAAAGTRVRRIALLTPRQVVPAGIIEYLENRVGRENVVDHQIDFYRIKYEKSDNEMRLIRDANVIADAMLRTMLAVIRPGMLETQVAAWAYLVGKELGSEENGWDVMVGANTANRTLIGKALNRPIGRGEWVHLGVAPKRDGLNSCVRRSLVAVESPRDVTADQRFWFDLVSDAYKVGYYAYEDVATHNKPACQQEKALVDFFSSCRPSVRHRFGIDVPLERFKPYTGTHNAGYTECQEFYGAITLDSHEPLGRQIVTMLDVAIRGIGNKWNDVVLPIDFVVIENTLGKFDKRVEQFNQVPNDVQPLVGNAE